MLVWIFFMALLISGIVWVILTVPMDNFKVTFVGLVVIILFLAITILPICGSHEESKEYKLVRIEHGSNFARSVLVLEDNGELIEIEVFKENIHYEDKISTCNYTMVKITKLIEDGLIWHTDGTNDNDISVTIYLNI